MPAVIEHFFSWLGVGFPAFLFVITLVVFFHELGHFIVARWCGVRVEAFSVGFGREIFGFTDRKGTRWKISWIPLGGYVRFLGDADVSSRPDPNVMREYHERKLAGTDSDAKIYGEPMHMRPVLQRAMVAAAGPVANFLLAIVIFAAVLLATGKPAAPPVVEAVTKGSAAEMAGIRPGDSIVKVGNLAVKDFTALQRVVSANAGRQLQLTILRDNHQSVVPVVPSSVEGSDEKGAKYSFGRLGIRDTLVKVGLGEALAGGVNQTWFVIAQTGSYVAKIVTGRESPDQLHGIVGIGEVSSEAAQIGFMALLSLAGLMSVSIGLVNLLPIPVLDGGHLLYYGCEAVLGRPLGERAQEVGFRLGLAFVLCLMLLATFNDLVRLNLF
ncbi:MAG TPA: RIP metalloprotease RseP [Micropepsaceae bacterium]|nr:RIP metalloprotease RseP [Micropepsaceae bacterium]